MYLLGRFGAPRFRFLFVLILAQTLGVFCGPDHEQGIKIARKYCSSCHVFPQPEELPRESWPFVLKSMGIYLGMNRQATVDGQLLEPKKGYSIAKQPMLSQKEWALLRQAYLSLAPKRASVLDSMPEYKKMPSSCLFQEVVISTSPKETIFSLVKFIGAQKNRLILGEGLSHQLMLIGQQGEVLSNASVVGAPVALMGKNPFTMVAAGSLFPNDNRDGVLQNVMIQGKKVVAADVFWKGVNRPVDAMKTRKGILVAEFGHIEGGLSLLSKTQGKWRRKYISEETGFLALSRSDSHIYVLRAQARESLLVLDIDTQNLHEEIRFSPSAGLTAMRLTDLNKDGNPELLLLNGDNGDLPDMPPKLSQGLRIYENKEKLKLKQFIFVDGGYDLTTGDYDGDGDMDIIVVSFFAHARPGEEQTITYLENQGGLRFQPFSIVTRNSNYWIRADSGDINKDAKLDIALGSGISRYFPRLNAISGKTAKALLLLGKGKNECK